MKPVLLHTQLIRLQVPEDPVLGILVVLLRTYSVSLLVQRLHHHHVPSLVNLVDWRVHLHQVSQFLSHALADLPRAAQKLPLLQMGVKDTAAIKAMLGQRRWL